MMNFIPEFTRLTRAYSSLGNILQAPVYAEVGPSINTRPDGSRFSIIAPPTCVANLLEATFLDAPGVIRQELDQIVPRAELTVTRNDAPDEVHTSLEASHRLASAWFLNHGRMIDEQGQAGKEGDFQKALVREFQEKGVLATIAYYCPNSVLHGFWLSQFKGLSPNYAKSPSNISGSIVADGITKVMTQGVSFDHILEAGTGMKINGKDAGKISKESLGHVPNSSTKSIVAESVELSLSIHYNRIRKLRLPVELREYLIDLANYKVALFLNDEIDIRRDTILYPLDNNHVDEEPLLKALSDSFEVCVEKGQLNPNVVLPFSAEIKSAQAVKA